jgi:hypothetical protein
LTTIRAPHQAFSSTLRSYGWKKKNIISFSSFPHMSISTYLRPNIHQNGLTCPKHPSKDPLRYIIDVNCDSGQQGRSMYSSFIYKLKPGFGRFFRRACNQFWNVLLRKDTQVWENDILMITGLYAYKTTEDALTGRRV